METSCFCKISILGSRIAEAAFVLLVSWLIFAVVLGDVAVAASSNACNTVNSSVWASGNTINPPLGTIADSEYAVPNFAAGEKLTFSVYSTNAASAGLVGIIIGTAEESFGDGSNDDGEFSFSGSGLFAAADGYDNLSVAYYVHNNRAGQTVRGSLTVTLTCVQAPPTITGLSPSQGPVAGNTLLTITGTGFTDATSASIGGASQVPTVLNDTTLTVITPPHAAGSVAVTVTNPGGTTNPPASFTYRLPPTVSQIQPNTGFTSVGTNVAITGNSFLGATGVTFDGVSGTSFSVSNDTSITVTAPPRSTGGEVDVVVTTPYGSITVNDGFTYVVPPPNVSSVSPNSGLTAGGTSVTINGGNLADVSQVTFGGLAATGVNVVSDSLITVLTPLHAAGAVSVEVTTPHGSFSLPGAYIYVAPVPNVSDVSANSGGTAGSTNVTITGTEFAAATAVTFGGTAADSYTVVSDTQITAVTPSHVAGAVSVAVTTAGGTGSLPAGFTYVAPLPVVSNLSSSSGPTAGGASVTITGSGFIGATSVTFGGAAANGVVIVNDTQITAFTPSHIAGPVNVSVTTAGGTGTWGATYEYIAPLPAVSGVSPGSGLTAGGESVDIAGSGFIGATSVIFGGIVVAPVTVVSDTQITMQTPAHAAGPVSVAVTTAGGTGSLGSAFIYIAPVPSITSISPSNGPIAGGTSVDIKGAGFTAATAVAFGLTAADSYTVVSDTRITAVTPSHVVGPVDVSVSTAGGTIQLPLGFTFVAPPPVVSGVSPGTGGTVGGTGVTITGSYFTGATAVMFGTDAATSVVIVSDTQITAATPPHIAGPVALAVTTGSGTGFLPAGYTYVAPVPSITSVSPNSGLTAGGTTITIIGSGMIGTTSVAIGGVAATAVNVVSDTQVTAVTGARAADLVGVALTTAGGTASVPSVYTYLAPVPLTTSITPNSGTTAGATSVTIDGSGFTAATSVTFGGMAAASYSVLSDTQITAVTPSRLPGTVNVDVATAGGTGTLNSGYTFIAPAPSISAINPNTGTTLGGTSVTIIGTGFTGTSSVTFGGVAATGLTVTGDTQITAITPAHAAGPVDVGVTTPGGVITVGSAFTYAVLLPTLTGISPSAGPTAGGTAVTITGTNLTGASSVTFGGIAASAVTLVSVTQMTAVTPPHAVGAVDVEVITPLGTASLPAAFSYTAIVRPDPSLDPEVIGLINTQTSTANRFARTQIRNFHGRLERLHNERERRSSSMDVRLGLPTDRARTPSERLLERQAETENAGIARAGDEADEGRYGYGTDGAGPVSSAAGSRSENVRDDAEFSRLAFWSSGFVNFGDRDDGGVDIDHTTIGVSGGFDYRFSKRFIAGLGIGYGRDRSDIGDNGTESTANAFSAAVYVSFEPFDNFFLDGLVGGSTLNFASKRFVTASGDFATGDRSGTQAFGSVTAAYEIREETWLVSPYGRLEFSRSWLDSFSETGGGIYSLAYGDQTTDTFSGILGIRANKSFEMEWGVLKPGIRAEYVHDFEGASRVRMGYSDLGTFLYEIEVLAKRRDYATLGLSLEFQFESDWSLLLDYRTSVDGGGDPNHSVGAQLSVRF